MYQVNEKDTDLDTKENSEFLNVLRREERAENDRMIGSWRNGENGYYH